jgi:bacterioferritin-associated ferredoxin
MIICVCQNVTEGDIARAVSGGCKSFAALQESLEVAQCCGNCECAARECFKTQRNALRASQGKASMIDWAFGRRASSRKADSDVAERQSL